MKSINVIISVIFLCAFQGLAQKNITVETESKIVGEDLLTGAPIMANQYTFPERIDNFQLDTIHNDVLIQLRGVRKEKWLNNRGEVVRYDVDENKVLWSEKIHYQKESIEQYGGMSLHTTGGKSYSLDNLTGQQLWEIKTTLVFADPIEKIGLGYRIQARKGKEKVLEGIDLTSGESIWQREINREYSWNEVFYLNDSTLLIAASGLHTLNIFDGSGWDYHTVTGKKDYTASAVGTGLGIAAGLLTGTFAVSSGHDLVRDVVSNIIVDSTSIYFASKEHLVKLNKEGQVQWQKSLPEDLTSKSSIFKYKNVLVMVNRGYAFMGYRQLKFGTPFIASFDLKTGEQNFLVTLNNEKKEFIQWMDQKDDELLLVFNEHISRYSLTEGNLISDQHFALDKFGGLNYFLGEQVFVERDSLFISLPALDTSKNYLYVKNGKVLVLNSDLEIEDEVRTEDFYIHYLDRGNKRFIAKADKTFIIDAEGRKIAEVAASDRSIFLNGKLYDAQEQSFQVIDLKSIIKDQSGL